MVDNDNVQLINDAEFEALIGSEQPTLVDFWVPWCGPRKAIGLLYWSFIKSTQKSQHS